MKSTYLCLLIEQAQKLEALHESEITELEQELLNDLSNAIEAEQLEQLS